MGFAWLTKDPTLTIPRLWLDWHCSSRTKTGLGVGETRGRARIVGGEAGRYLRRGGGVHGGPPRWGPALYLAPGRRGTPILHLPPAHRS